MAGNIRLVRNKALTSTVSGDSSEEKRSQDQGVIRFSKRDAVTSTWSQMIYQ